MKKGGSINAARAVPGGKDTCHAKFVKFSTFAPRGKVGRALTSCPPRTKIEHRLDDFFMTSRSALTTLLSQGAQDCKKTPSPATANTQASACQGAATKGGEVT